MLARTSLPSLASPLDADQQNFRKNIIQPHFQQPYDAEVEEGKSGWAARSLRMIKAALAPTHQRHGRQRQLPHPGHDAPRGTSPGPPQPPALAPARTDVRAHRQPLVPAKSRLIPGCQPRPRPCPAHATSSWLFIRTSESHQSKLRSMAPGPPSALCCWPPPPPGAARALSGTNSPTGHSAGAPTGGKATPTQGESQSPAP